MQFAAIVWVLWGACASAGDSSRSTGPWKITELEATPRAIWGPADAQGVRTVFYDNVPLAGKTTRVFAYYARPRGDGPFPAMLLLHGGGGHAFREWAELWAARGYAALAMDLSGRGPDGKRLPDGGPEQSDDVKFRDFAAADVPEMWTYHAVAAGVRGVSLLVSRPEVDANRIGVTGISWGGYLTCIVAGVDSRLKVAVPVYGCGFLDENSYWKAPRFDHMGSEKAKMWADLFDPSRYLPGVSCPILFVNGTNDFAYPLDSYRKSYRLVTKAPVDLCIKVAMPHGHSQGWAPAEIGLFVDSVLRGGARLARVRTPEQAGDRLAANVTTARAIRAAKVHTTEDIGPWQPRVWKTAEARYEEGMVSIKLPAGDKPLVVYFTVEDDRGAVSSSPHVGVKSGRVD
jgi:dienelactone hydrolase